MRTENEINANITKLSKLQKELCNQICILENEYQINFIQGIGKRNATFDEYIAKLNAAKEVLCQLDHMEWDYMMELKND